MSLDLSTFDNAQLDVLNSYIDNYDVFRKLIDCIDFNYSPEQIEVIGKAIGLGMDVTNILNSRLSLECMLLLCEAIRSGIDVIGLDNSNIDINLLKELIKIKTNSNYDMSFVRNLSLAQCQELVRQFSENKNFDYISYIEKINCDRTKSIMEIQYALKGNAK